MEESVDISHLASGMTPPASSWLHLKVKQHVLIQACFCLTVEIMNRVVSSKIILLEL